MNCFYDILRHRSVRTLALLFILIEDQDKIDAAF
jgi:hypothetical protein